MSMFKYPPWFIGLASCRNIPNDTFSQPPELGKRGMDSDVDGDILIS